MDWITLITIFLLLVCLFGLSWFAGSDAPFVATISDKIKPALKKAGVKKDKIFYELGSGDGRVVLEAAKMGAKSNGIEQSWIRVWYSRFLAKRTNLPHASFFHGNIFDRNYYTADIVFIFLLPNAVHRLETKLKKELKPNAVIITQRYHFKSWKPFDSLGEFNYYRQAKPTKDKH